MKAADILYSTDGIADQDTDGHVGILVDCIAEESNYSTWRHFLHEYAVNDLGSAEADKTSDMNAERLISHAGWTPAEMLSMALEYIDTQDMGKQLQGYIEHRHSPTREMFL